MLRRKNIVVLFMALILTIAIFAVLSINSTRKGGEGTGMFEVNSNSLSIYVNEKKKKLTVVKNRMRLWHI